MPKANATTRDRPSPSVVSTSTAALEVGREAGPDAVIVVLLPDSGRGYLSKLYNDEWMADFGFLRGRGQSAGDLLAAKGGDLPALVHAHPTQNESLGEAHLALAGKPLHAHD